MNNEKDLLRPTWIVEDYDVMRSNIRHLKEFVGNDVRLICVVKGNAYGCGLQHTVRVLDQEDIYGYGTGNIYEALEVRKLSSRPIVLFGNTLPNAISEIQKNNITPSITDWDWLADYSRQAKSPMPVFVKIDVGGNRLGIPFSEAVDFVEKASKLPNIRIEGIHTHVGWPLAEKAVQEIKRITNQLEERGVFIPIKMVANSEVTAQLPDAWMGAVNPGKLIYGIRPCELKNLDVQPVFKELKSKLILIKKPVDDSLKNVDRIGTIPVGFADGLPSSYMKGGSYVLIRGKRAPIIKIHAEHTRVDLSNIPEARVSDEAVVIGTDGEERICASTIASKCGMTESELLRNLAHCIPSVCVEEGQTFITNPISTR